MYVSESSIQNFFTTHYKTQLFTSVLLGAWAASPLVLAAIGGSESIYGLNVLTENSIVKMWIAGVAAGLCNVAINFCDTSKALRNFDQLNSRAVTVALVGAVAKVGIAYKELTFLRFLVLGVPAVVIFTFVNLRGARSLIKKFSGKEEEQPRSKCEKAAGYFLFAIVAVGIIGYCGTAGRALIYLGSAGHLENPAWYFSFLAALPTSVVFCATIYNGCLSVASRIFGKQKKEGSLLSKLGEEDEALLVGRKTKWVLYLLFFALAYPSAAPTTASNVDFAIPYCLMVQNICSNLTVELFNSLGMTDLLERSTWKKGDDAATQPLLP